MVENSAPRNILISGMMRSGTTLLQRALDAHKQINISYQSNTSDFLEMKQQFHDEIGEPAYHVLTHYNPEQGYSFSDFDKWLRKHPALGRLTRNAGHTVSPETMWMGVKEVLVEEFYPALIDEGVYCLNILRDPRDVIASMSFGQNSKHTGKRRPVLFDLRNWRKSVHFAYYLRKNRIFKCIRFEDLILKSDRVIQDIFDWLNVDKVTVEYISQVMTRSNWAGNSSFGDKNLFDPTAVNNYHSRLPEPVKFYIEAVCWPEMSYLGYKATIQEEDREIILSEYTDPFEIDRPEFSQDYSSSATNIRYEQDRLGRSFSEINTAIFG